MIRWNEELVVLESIWQCCQMGWRMNPSQLTEYVGHLCQRQPDLLPGYLGECFLGLISETDNADVEWSAIMKDIGEIKRLIIEHSEWDVRTWECCLQRLQVVYEQYFLTRLGEAFVHSLREKINIEQAKQRKKESRSPAWQVCGFQNAEELSAYIDWVEKESEVSEQEDKQPVNVRKRFEKPVSKLIMIVCGCLFFGFLGKWIYVENAQNQSIQSVQEMKKEAKKENVETEGRIVAQTVETNEEQVEDLVVLPEYVQMTEQYPDVYGWLRIPDTDIDLPVMRSSGEENFYLYHNYEGVETTEGALFVDKRNNLYPMDENTVIYGHNMRNGHIFGQLKSYTGFDFYEKHRRVEFDTIYEKGIYEAVAVLKTRIMNEEEEGFRYYQFFNSENEAEFDACVEFVRENSIYPLDEELQYGDQILMLSTCEYSQDNGRLVIVAKRVNQ